MDLPAVRYVERPEGWIAYETLGDRSVDLVHIAGWNQTVEGIWDLPSAERFYRRLASFARVVLVDRRGVGLSDPLQSRYAGGDLGPWLEEAVDDVVVVLDEIGSDQAVVLGNGYGTFVGIVIAATRPERVAGVILVDPIPRVMRTDDYPWAFRPPSARRSGRRIVAGGVKV